ncbi:MAG: hypothetical protein IKJ43_00215 [Bacilli bacterium]|nr:hypothetical protein [Bacilli bacterium]
MRYYLFGVRYDQEKEFVYQSDDVTDLALYISFYLRNNEKYEGAIIVDSVAKKILSELSFISVSKNENRLIKKVRKEG